MKVTKLKIDTKHDIKNFFNILFKNKKYNDKILNSIIFGINNDLIKVKVFELHMIESKVNITYHRNKWDEILNILMKYYIEIEEYEKCTIIKKLLENEY